MKQPETIHLRALDRGRIRPACGTWQQMTSTPDPAKVTCNACKAVIQRAEAPEPERKPDAIDEINKARSVAAASPLALAALAGAVAMSFGVRTRR